MICEDQFLAYIDAFAAADYARLTTFYHPDVRLTIGTGRELVGPDAITDFYRHVNAVTRRDIKVRDCFASGDRLAAELHSEFTVMADTVDIWPEPASRGDRLRIESFALYECKGDQFLRIRAAVLHRAWHRKVFSVAMGEMIALAHAGIANGLDADTGSGWIGESGAHHRASMGPAYNRQA